MNHYFIDNPDLESNVQLKEVKVKGVTLKFYTDNGVFSKRGLDFGTRSLLEALPPNISGNVLDFGCGYGPIGIYLAKTTTDTEIDMIDINKRSIDLAKKNIKLNKVNANAFVSDMYSNVSLKYDYIISNPPIRVGKEILYKILITAKDYLKIDGQLWIVINVNQGAKTVVRDLKPYYTIEVIDKNKGFYTICASKH